MGYLTFDKLNNMGQLINKNFSLNELNKSYKLKSNMVFLSHRHSEKEIVKKVVGFLSEFGEKIYIDWLDNEMPLTTSTDTANKLKDKIQISKKFILLATPESIKSIWIPWELGFADGKKGLDNIAVLPLLNKDDKWEEREYYGIYNYITELSGNNWVVYQPDGQVTFLKGWLNS